MFEPLAPGELVRMCWARFHSDMAAGIEPPLHDNWTCKDRESGKCDGAECCAQFLAVRGEDAPKRAAALQRRYIGAAR